MFLTQENNFRSQSRALAGFTLIELMTVMILMLLIATASVVSWNNLKRGNELTTAINDIRSSLALARQYAVLKKTEIRIGFVSTNPQIYFITNNAGGGLLRGALQELPLGTRFAHSPQDVVFGPNGAILNNQTMIIALEDVNNTNISASLRVNGLTGIINYD